MKRFDLLASLIVFVAACGTDEPSQQVIIEEDVPSSAPETQAPEDPVAIKARYRIVAVPTGIAFGHSQASKLICSGDSVVGTASFSSGSRAIVFDYVTMQLTELGTLGGAISQGNDGNARGTIVGQAAPAVGNGRAFAYRDGVMTELPGIGGDGSYAWALNERDQIVGAASVPGSGDVPSRAVLWEPGCTAPIDLGTLGLSSFARGINEAGVIVGTAVTLANEARAVMWGADRQLVDLGTGGARESQAMDINAAGTIAGFTRSPNHAVVIDNGVFVDLGTLGGMHSHALALDDNGSVVGMSTDVGDASIHAFLYEDGAMIDLDQLVDDPRWELSQAIDICNNGRIAGNGMLDGIPRGFVLIPEASP